MLLFNWFETSRIPSNLFAITCELSETAVTISPLHEGYSHVLFTQKPSVIHLLGLTSLSFHAAPSSKQGNAYQIHMVAQDKKRSIQELYITIGKNYIPSQVKMRQGTNWTTINITNFKAKNQSDAVFTFNAKEFPKAEVIDLR